MKSSGSELFFAWKFLVTDSISLLVISLFRFSFCIQGFTQSGGTEFPIGFINADFQGLQGIYPNAEDSGQELKFIPVRLSAEDCLLTMVWAL